MNVDSFEDSLLFVFKGRLCCSILIFYNIFVLQLHKVFILNVTPGVFKLKYLSFNWVKSQK